METISNDQSVHGYRERYDRILFQCFPDKFPKPILKKEGVSKPLEPFKISEENRKVLWEYYTHQEATSENSIARRWTIFRLLSRMAILLEGLEGFQKKDLTFQNLLSHPKAKDMAKALVLKVRSQAKWNRTTENFHLRALKQILRHLNGGDATPQSISWLRFKLKKADAGEDVSKQPKTINREDILSEKEIQSLFKIAKTPMERCIIAVLWEGLRAGEVLSLKKSSITSSGNFLDINVKGKTGKRIVRSATGSRHIREWLSQHPNQETDDWLFVITSNKNKGKRFGYSPLNNLVHGLLIEANIQKRGNLHVFRHSRVVDMLIKGYSPAIIQKVMGWTSLDMLQTYGHLVDSDAHNEVMRIESGESLQERKKSILSSRVCDICLKENDLTKDVCEKCGNALTDKGLALKNMETDSLRNEMQELKEQISLITLWMKRFGQKEPTPKEAKALHEEWIKKIV